MRVLQLSRVLFHRRVAMKVRFAKHPAAIYLTCTRFSKKGLPFVKKRKEFYYVREFEKHGLDPKQADIVVVKLGYLVPELFDIQVDWMMALTRGGVDQNLINLPYKRINRPMFPLDKDMSAPDLSAKLVPFVGD